MGPKLKFTDIQPGMYVALRYSEKDSEPYVLYIQTVNYNTRKMDYIWIAKNMKGTEFAPELDYRVATAEEIASDIAKRIAG